MKKLIILVASTGHNKKLAEKVSEHASNRSVNCEIINIPELKLPLYDSLSEKDGVPEVINGLRDKISSSDAFAVIAPEYNGSIPPCLNNTIAWISRSHDDWRKAFNGKPCFIGTHSGGGGSYALLAMRQQLSYIGANVIGRQLLTNYNKPVADDSIEACLDQVLF